MFFIRTSLLKILIFAAENNAFSYFYLGVDWVDWVLRDSRSRSSKKTGVVNEFMSF